MTVSSLAPWLGGFQCLPVINAVAPEAEGQVPGAAPRLCGTNPRRRITGSRLQTFLYLSLPLVVVGRCQDEPSCHRGQGRPSAQPLPSTHGPQMQERLPWPHYRADTTWLTQRQFSCHGCPGHVSSAQRRLRSPEPARAWHVLLRRRWGWFVGPPQMETLLVEAWGPVGPPDLEAETCPCPLR